MKPLTILIKKSPIVIVRNFIALEAAGYVAFLVVRLLADYGQLYNRYSFPQLLSYRVAETTFFILTEMIITLFIFLHWFFEYYQITAETFTYSSGVVFRKKEKIPLEAVELIRHQYGILGKIFGYGTLVLRHKETGREIKLADIPIPQRYETLIRKLKKERPDGPASATIFHPVEDVEQMMASAENEHLEFKSTMRWDKKNGVVNRALEKTVMKTIAAFLNSEGGMVVVGINDDRTVAGLESDFKSLTRPDADGFENHFTLVFNNTIGAEFRRLVKLYFKKFQDKDICVIQVVPSSKPVYLLADNVEEFYVRTGNSTTSLKISEAASYLDVWRRKDR